MAFNHFSLPKADGGDLGETGATGLTDDTTARVFAEGMILDLARDGATGLTVRGRWPQRLKDTRAGFPFSVRCSSLTDGCARMTKAASPICPTCRKPMQFSLRKNASGREFRCLDCTGDDPLQSSDVAKLLTALRPLK
jgi:hypothetical protein